MTSPKSSDLKLVSEINTEMQAEIEGFDGRFKVILVGVVEQASLIYSVTESLAPQLDQLLHKAKPEITIRGISRGDAFGFQSTGLRFIHTPSALLFTSFPKFIQHQTIRNSRRVKCLLPGKFALDTIGVAGVIADISNSGCHFQTQSNLNNHQARIIKPDTEVLISFVLPGKEVPKTIEAIIKNTFVEEDNVHIGMQFVNVDSITLKLLNEFIALSFDISPF